SVGAERVPAEHDRALTVALAAGKDDVASLRLRRFARIGGDLVARDLDAGSQQRQSVGRLQIDEDPGAGVAHNSVSRPLDVEDGLTAISRTDVEPGGSASARARERVALHTEPDRPGDRNDIPLSTAQDRVRQLDASRHASRALDAGTDPNVCERGSVDR